MGRYTVYRHEGSDAVRELHRTLTARGWPPAPSFSMELDYLAGGFEGNHPIALVVQDGDRPVACMPLALRRSVFPLRLGPVTVGSLPYGELRLLGYQGVTLDDREVLDLCFQYLAHRFPHTYDIVKVSELPAAGSLADYFDRPTPGFHRSFIVSQRTVDSYRIAIRGGLESYYQGRFNKKSRYNLKRSVKLFQEKAGGTIAFKVYTSEEEVEAFTREADRVARHTYQLRRGYESITLSEATRARLAHFARCGQLRSYVLFRDGDPCAYCYGVVHRRTFLYEITGYDERVAALSPGTVLLMKILEDLFASGVADEFDFGSGSADYKRLFATSNSSVRHVSLFRKAGYPRLLHQISTGLEWLSVRTKPWALTALRFLRGIRPRRASVENA